VIYLDAAATSLQKPVSVLRTVNECMRSCASPGRGDYPAARRAGQVLYECRQEAADLFGANAPEQVIFTVSATHGLNIAIRSYVRPGSRVVISGYEHNAVTRTLESIPGVNVVSVSGKAFDTEGDRCAFEQAFKTVPDVVICCHVSNVFGYILPVKEVADLCRERSVPLIVDASQSAGILPVSLQELGASCIAMPGHKGLLGPQGTGLLIVREGERLMPVLTGGTGSESRLQTMPDFLPDRLEAGTHPVAAIGGLSAGIRAVKSMGRERILSHERRLIQQLERALKGFEKVEVLGPEREEDRIGVLSFRVKGQDCEEIAGMLAEKGFALRAGLHCAPLAHRTAGTLETGTIRVSLSPYNTEAELAAFVRTLGKILQK